jgi:hypothetical protein
MYPWRQTSGPPLLPAVRPCLWLQMASGSSSAGSSSTDSDMPPLASGSPRSDPEVPPLVHSNTASTIASTALDTESHSHMHFGYPPEVDFFDEKPFHYNESGSKNQKTLEWKGKQEVELLECPAQATRSRWTACTYATSDSSLNREGTQPLRIPPAQLMFKERMTPIIEYSAYGHESPHESPPSEWGLHGGPGCGGRLLAEWLPEGETHQLPRPQQALDVSSSRSRLRRSRLWWQLRPLGAGGMRPRNFENYENSEAIRKTLRPLCRFCCGGLLPDRGLGIGPEVRRRPRSWHPFVSSCTGNPTRSFEGHACCVRGRRAVEA